MFYSRLPGVPLERARLNFDQSLLDNPNFFGTRFLRARYYHTKLGNRELFEEDLQFIINGDPSLLPDAMPENLFEQEKAEQLLRDAIILFEWLSQHHSYNSIILDIESIFDSAVEVLEKVLSK